MIAVDGATIRDDLVAHPLLGDAHPIADRDGAVITHVSAIAWARPTEIPAIAEPGKLPPGVGGAIMNELAVRARDGGVTALRYAGPYPTSALWKTLLRSFRTQGTEEAFTRDLIERMATLSRAPIPIDFAPAPHERVAHAHGHVEVRDGIERAMIDGIAYERDGSPARLTDDRATGVTQAELWFGDVRYVQLATFADDGTLIDGPREIPRCGSDVIGKVFPAALVGALASLIAEAVPAPLATAVPGWLAARTIAWADLGARLARVRADVVEVHAALWQHLAPHGLGRVALSLAEALAPVISAALVADLQRATVRR